jgi:hypothetical protein
MDRFELTTRVNERVAFRAAESVTRAVNGNDPVCVGVPLSTPAEESVIPAGSDPDASAHVYGGVPPVAARAALYGVPAVAAGKASVVMASGELMVMLTFPVVVADLGSGTGAKITNAESVTRTLNTNVPARDGVPVICPFAARVKPGGKEPVLSDQVYGGTPPLAVRVAE